MYSIFAYIYHVSPLKNQPNVAKYTSPMDATGLGSHVLWKTHRQRPGTDQMAPMAIQITHADQVKMALATSCHVRVGVRDPMESMGGLEGNGWLVGWMVGWLVGRSVGWLVGWLVC